MDHADDDTDLPLPNLDALVAGTVALMTAWAAPCPEARFDPPAQRSLLARKVVSNLYFLQHHPQASEALRRVMANAHAHWVTVAHGAASASACVPTVEASSALH